MDWQKKLKLSSSGACPLNPCNAFTSGTHIQSAPQHTLAYVQEMWQVAHTTVIPDVALREAGASAFTHSLECGKCTDLPHCKEDFWYEHVSLRAVFSWLAYTAKLLLLILSQGCRHAAHWVGNCRSFSRPAVTCAFRTGFILHIVLYGNLAKASAEDVPAPTQCPSSSPAEIFSKVTLSGRSDTFLADMHCSTWD